MKMNPCPNSRVTTPIYGMRRPQRAIEPLKPNQRIVCELDQVPFLVPIRDLQVKGAFLIDE
jgi:hypothetical protein